MAASTPDQKMELLLVSKKIRLLCRLAKTVHVAFSVASRNLSYGSLLVNFPNRSKYWFLPPEKPLYARYLFPKIPNDAASHAYLSVPVFSPFVGVCVCVMDMVHCMQRNTILLSWINYSKFIFHHKLRKLFLRLRYILALEDKQIRMFFFAVIGLTLSWHAFDSKNS